MTDADRTLIDFAGRHGFTVSWRQLKRWRSYGVLPWRTRRHRGYARGTSSEDQAGTAEQLVALCQRLYVDRRLSHAAMWLWYEGWEIPTRLVRKQLVDYQQRGVSKMIETAESIGALQDGAGLAAIVDPLGLGYAETYGNPVPKEEEDRMKAALGHLLPDPAGETRTPVQLVHDMRGDLIAANLAPPGEIAVDEDLLAHWTGSPDSINIIDKAGFDVMSELTRVVTHAPPPDDVLAILRDGPDELYERGRVGLRRFRDTVAMLRDGVAEISAVSPDFASALEQNLQQCAPQFDTREASYRHGALIEAICMMVVNEATGLVQA